MGNTPMDRLEKVLGNVRDDDHVPGGLVRAEDLRTVVAVAKDAKSWSEDVKRLVMRVKDLEAELAAETALGDYGYVTLEAAHATYARGLEEAAERAREWTLRAVAKRLEDEGLSDTEADLCGPARQLTIEELLRPWAH
jgi:hypothetical protein